MKDEQPRETKIECNHGTGTNTGQESTPDVTARTALTASKAIKQ